MLYALIVHMYSSYKAVPLFAPVRPSTAFKAKDRKG